MATVAVGDIHGNLEALDEVLCAVTPDLGRGDTLVFLGDYVDRCPDVRQCIDRILRCREEASCEVVGLLGNHDNWMLESFHDQRRHTWAVGVESFPTIRSYSAEAARRLEVLIDEAGYLLITERRPLPYHLFFDAMPAAHIEFFLGLRKWWLTADALCVHASVRGGVPMEEQNDDDLLMGMGGWPECYSDDLPVIYGHFGDAVEGPDGWPAPRYGENGTIGIDASARGVVMAVRLPERRVFRGGRLRAVESD